MGARAWLMLVVVLGADRRRADAGPCDSFMEPLIDQDLAVLRGGVEFATTLEVTNVTTDSAADTVANITANSTAGNVTASNITDNVADDSALTVQDCCQLCLDTDGCDSFVMINLTCFLKQGGTPAPLAPHPGRTSYLKKVESPWEEVTDDANCIPDGAIPLNCPAPGPEYNDSFYGYDDYQAPAHHLVPDHQPPEDYVKQEEPELWGHAG